MILCIAEKPSVGRDIARVLGANTQRDGFMEGNGYCVSWTFGHLCALLDPHEYNDQWKGWNLSSLPMVPVRFGIKVSDDKGILKQFNTIKDLISKAEMVINCGDAGQEGELIQRWVYQKAGCKVPVKRLWISSLTEDAIREGFANLKDQSHYQHLYEAGMMRAIGDWLLGMNATRAYTLRFAKGVGKDRQVLSIGRVQTPTLALIVKRQYEIENFVPRTYWELKTVYRDTTFSAQLPAEEDDYAITSLEQGQVLLDSIKDLPLEITSVEKKKGTEFAPRLFDLTSLQVECNKKFSLSADDTLKIIQSLYEKHVTTYPRVDTTYLSDDIYPKVPATLQGIKDYFPLVTPLLSLKADGKKGTDSLPKSKKVFDNKKVTDHHAIIPTGQRPDNLSELERKVYNLVALRFIAAFYPDCEVSNTTVLAKAGDIDFKVTGRQILKMGWREVSIDERYIDRIAAGLGGVFERQGTEYAVEVSTVYPDVKDGLFRADFTFVGETPRNIRVGQTYYINLQLGEPTEAVLIPRGSFFASTGGKWVYVLSPDGSEAVRREIKIARQNPVYYEVVEGLQPGERVITSSYDNFGKSERLILN